MILEAPVYSLHGGHRLLNEGFTFVITPSVTRAARLHCNGTFTFFCAVSMCCWDSWAYWEVGLYFLVMFELAMLCCLMRLATNMLGFYWKGDQASHCLFSLLYLVVVVWLYFWLFVILPLGPSLICHLHSTIVYLFFLINCGQWCGWFSSLTMFSA